jgi:neutral amino acid transport system substrate-binding protein
MPSRPFRSAIRLAACALLVGFGCVTPPSDPDPNALLVGALLPYTGSQSTSGANLERALLLAAEQVNAAGGVAGRPIRIVARDTRSDPEHGYRAAIELLDEGVQALIGPEEEGLAQRLAPVMKQRRIPLLSGGVVAPAFTAVDDGDFCFRTSPSALLLGRELAEKIDADGVRSAVVLHVADEYGVGFSNVLQAELSLHGIDAGTPLALDPSLSSQASLIRMVMARSPDAVILVGYPDVAASLLLEWAAFGISGRWYLSPSLEHQIFPDNLPPAIVEGMVGVAPAAGADAALFAQRFADRWYGEQPTVGAHFYFDALVLWALAAEASLMPDGTIAPEQLRMQLRRVSGPEGERVSWSELGRAMELVRAGTDIDLAGASGAVDLDEWGEPKEVPTRLWSISGGRIVHP